MAKEEQGIEELADPNKASMLTGGDDDAAAAIDAATESNVDESEAAETETETEDGESQKDSAEAETETETEDEDSPDLALLREAGIDGTFKTVPAALAGTAEGLRFIEQQRQELQQQHQQITNMTNAFNRVADERRGEGPTAPTEEDLVALLEASPREAFTRAGLVSSQQLTPILNELQQMKARADHQDLVTAVGQHEDLKDVAKHLSTYGALPSPGMSKLWDEMMRLYDATPGFAAGRNADAIPVLYNAARNSMPKPGPKVPPVSDGQKRSARTTGGGRGKKSTSSVMTEERLKQMSTDELEQWLREQGAG